MKKDGFKLVVFAVALSLLPAYSNALVEEKSSIVGRLVGAAEQPISGVSIHLLDSFFLIEIAQAITDKNGKFTIPNVLPGLYLVSVDAPSLSSMMKRVQVVSGTPTFLDLKSILSEEELKKHSAWERFKWTVRVAERNPLRDEESTVSGQVKPATYSTEDGFFAFLKNLRESNHIKGEISYVNIGVGPSDASWSHQMTQFAVQGDLEGEGTWAFNGNVLDGSRLRYTAAGDFRYRLFGHQLGATVAANDLVFARYPSIERQLIRRFGESPELDELAEENKLWITSLDLKDEWQPLEGVRLNYGTRIDYYGYLRDPVGYSPRVSLSYEMTPAVAVRGLYYRNQSAPGNYYLQPDDVHPYIHDVAFVPYHDDLKPETTVGVEAGVDFSVDNLNVSVFYHSEDIRNKIATVDIAGSPVNLALESVRPFVIFNSSELESRGVTVQINKQVTSVVRAFGSYNMTESVPLYIIEKRSMQNRQLFFRRGKESQDLHDVVAGIEAHIPQTQTEVKADWNWSSGSALVFGRDGDDSALCAVDVEVHQGIPVNVFSQTELTLLLAIKNVLDQNSEVDTNADFERALLYGMPRVVAGGLLLKF
ncbi:MAG TPA: TonB-dependent receptor [Acidobacteriota bacterium]|nr:TonB-dependent receptor [Acidobacteriota bacterium]